MQLIFFSKGLHMLLAIDVGNTNTVFAIHDDKKFLASWRCETLVGRTADEYFVWLNQLMKLNKILGHINRVVVSSTVPRVVFNLRVLSDRYFNCRPLVIGKPDCFWAWMSGLILALQLELTALLIRLVHMTNLEVI
jgi:hypothetical protein